MPSTIARMGFGTVPSAAWSTIASPALETVALALALAFGGGSHHSSSQCLLQCLTWGSLRWTTLTSWALVTSCDQLKTWA